MKKLSKILAIILGIVILLYLISIPILRSKNKVDESVFFTPTPYNKAALIKDFNENKNFYIQPDTLKIALEKFTSSKNADSIKINGVMLKRDFKNFDGKSQSEYFVFEPKSTKKVGIYCMGNGFNIFKLVHNLSELAKRTQSKIYVLNYNKYGLFGGEANFATQLPLNQDFYQFVSEKQPISFVAGHSLGTVFAAKLAVDNKIPNLFLLAPASNLDDLINFFKSQLPLPLRPYINTSELENSVMAKSGNTSENIKNYSGNLTLFHGTKDENLPYCMSGTILKNCPSKNKELITINGGDHESPYLKENWEKLISKIANL